MRSSIRGYARHERSERHARRCRVGRGHLRPIVSDRLYDGAFDLWLEAGHYASRPPGEVHGPFRTEVGCVVLEVSFPMRRARSSGA
jgi:hypothetical protein